MVKTKKWEQQWRARRKNAWVRGADASMSLSSNGHFLVDEEGRYLRATDLVAISEEDQRSLDASVPVLEEVQKSSGPFALEEDHCEFFEVWRRGPVPIPCRRCGRTLSLGSRL